MSKSLRQLNEPTRFCVDLLAEVDREEFEDAIYVLKHSFAAREVFALLQFELHYDTENVQFAYCKALEAISCEVAHRAHGRRRTGVTGFKFKRLAKALEVPKERNEWGETSIRTINGWWLV